MKRHECKIDLMNILFCMLKGTLCLAAFCSRGTHAHMRACTHSHRQQLFVVKFIDDRTQSAYEKRACLAACRFPAEPLPLGAGGGCCR